VPRDEPLFIESLEKNAALLLVVIIRKNRPGREKIWQRKIMGEQLLAEKKLAQIQEFSILLLLAKL